MNGAAVVNEEEFFTQAEDLMKELCGFRYARRCNDIHGGLTNRASVFETDQGHFFVKYALRNNAYSMFTSEVESLKHIEKTKIFRVPKPIKVIEVKGKGALLVMELLENMIKINSEWEQLGEKLARLHNENPDSVKRFHMMENFVHSNYEKRPVEKFGFSHPVYYGPCFNSPAVWCDTWEEFYINHQLRPQFEQLEKTGDREFIEMWSKLSSQLHKYKKAPGPPSLTHGDFCAINIGEIGKDVVLFDPCTLYAPAETDFTIPTMMAGNMKPKFYETYHTLRPRAKDHEIQISAQLAFAFPLVYNIPGQDEVTREETLSACKHFYTSLKKA